MNLHRSSLTLCFLPILMAGCASTGGPRFGGTADSKSIAVVGDRPLPSTTGEPGGTVAAETEEPEPRRDPKTRISGRVLDESGDPVAGATVRLADGGSKGGKQVQGTTDESGAFTLNGLRPGSSYVVIAEAEDERGAVSGRVEARTAKTGVEIVLASEEKKPTARRSSSKPPRAKAVSRRDESDDSAEPEETTRINREDVSREGDSLDPGPPVPAAGRPRLGSPETGVGWKNSKKAVAGRSQDADTEEATTSPDDSTKPRRTARAKVPADDEDETNPLPPALDAGESVPADEPAPARVSSTKAKKPKKPTAPPRESGDLSLAPEASLDSPTGTGPAEPTIADKSRPLEPEVAPSPAAEVASAGPKAAGPVISAGLPSLPPVGGDPLAMASSPSPTPSPPDLPPTIQDATPSKPANSPAFASNVPAEYNPFAQVAASAFQAGPSPPERASERLKPPEDPVARVEPTKAIEAPPKKKWGELAVAAASPASASASAVVVEPTKVTLPGPFGRRRRGQAQAQVESKDSAIALCTYDTKLRKITDFRLPDLEGRTIRFQDLDADYVLLDFWGTWCAPCLEAIPHLVELQKKYGPDRFKVVGIACEEVPPEQRKAKVDEVSKKLGINYPILLSTMDGKPCPVQQALQIQAMPTMILVDRRGQVLWRNSGSTPASDSRLDRVLALSMSRGDSVRR